MKKLLGAVWLLALVAAGQIPLIAQAEIQNGKAVISQRIGRIKAELPYPIK